MTNMLHVIKKNVAAHNKRAKISPSTSVLFATRVRILRVFFASELIFTFPYAGSSIQNISEQFVSCIRLSPVNFALRQTPQTKIIT